MPTTDLLRRVEALEQSQRQNPLSVELLVNSAKRYLAKSEYRIHLDELFTQEVDRLLKELDAPDFDPAKPFSQKDFHRRVRKYESITEPLARMVGVLGRWGMIASCRSFWTSSTASTGTPKKSVTG
jgi:hypothetical protein